MAATPSRLVLATRGSDLALRQAELTQARLEAIHPRVEVALEVVRTSGDRQTQWSLEQQGGVGLFTLEVERAVREGRADIAVHSAKDMPTQMEPDVTVAACLPREAVNDVLVVRKGVGVPQVIATGSPRRRAQAKRLFPKAVWKEIRGNVDTRLRKIANGEAEATLLAAAGLKRLGILAWAGVDLRPLEVRQMVPAPAQGAIALQTLTEKAHLLEGVGCGATLHAVTVERALLRALGGGCHTAYAAHWSNGRLWTFHETTGHGCFECAESAGPELDARIETIAKAIQSA
ncbi:MAG: hydroxymethylbilane synthase [Opitutales bacterium]